MDTDIEVLESAQAKFALFLASLFQRAGVVDMPEFADLLEVFARTVAEVEPAEAAVLSRWAEQITAAAGD